MRLWFILFATVGANTRHNSSDTAGLAVEDNQWVGSAVGATDCNINERRCYGCSNGRWSVRLLLWSLVALLVLEAGGRRWMVVEETTRDRKRHGRRSDMPLNETTRAHHK